MTLKAAPSPVQAYDALVAEGRIAADAAQEAVAERLEALAGELAGKKRLLTRRTAPKGLYIWGDVGRGKSMLMDLFFTSAPLEAKRRVHFHAFMQEVHTAIHRIRAKKTGDPVAVLVAELAAATRLLCFDELQATDVADATLLFRLFEGLTDAGVVIVATSNRPPREVYQGGVQAERFAKFIALIDERMEPLSLMGDQDYRRAQAGAPRKAYFTGEGADERLREAVGRLAEGETAKRTALTVQGRRIWVNAYGGKVATSTFPELCWQPLGAADYLALAQAFPALALFGVPLLSPEKRNEAKRFVTLVDTLYEHKVKLLMSAAAEPDALYPEGDGSFEFRRTASRLAEMGGWE